jgi:hypothetical protein
MRKGVRVLSIKRVMECLGGWAAYPLAEAFLELGPADGVLEKWEQRAAAGHVVGRQRESKGAAAATCPHLHLGCELC